MKYLLQAWKWCSGKKTLAGAVLLFVDGGLMALGVEVPGLNELGMALVGGGLLHKAVKK